MAVKSLRRIPTYVWIPPVYSPVYKIEIETASGETYDVTDVIRSGDVTYGITETIGSFNFIVDNSGQDYTGKFSLYDKVNIYMDYAVTATTKKFVGLIEKVSHQKFTIRITGRSSAVRTMGTTITKTYSDTYTHDIIQDLINTYFSGIITYNNVDTTESTDTRVDVDWYQKPFWECVQELCFRAGYDAYIDVDFDFHYFVSGSRLNTTEVVVHECNLIETGEFAPDLSVIKNRIIVYGAQVENMQVIWTAEDSDSISQYDVKEEIISDSNIRTVEQARARAEYELSVKKDPPIVGEVTSLGLPTLAPGEKVRISDPLNNLEPKYYTIQKFTHKFSNDDPMKTVLTVQKEISTIPKILKKRIKFEFESTEKENPNGMKYSWLFTFDSDSGVHSGTEIIEGVLKTDGGTSGTWISSPNNLDFNATYCELRVSGESLVGTDYWVSTDGGTTWQSITPNTLNELSPFGPNLKIKIGINSASTQIDSIVLLYK